LSVGGQDFPHRLLKCASGLDATADILDPVLGDMLDVLLAPHHKGQRPHGMAAALGTVAGGLAATEIGQGQGAGEQIVGKLETSHELELALPQSGRLGSSGFVIHLMV
jgi:hypothetical protein